MTMTDEEFDLLDELYFVQHFDYLKETMGWAEDLLLTTLDSLYKKSYIKCLKGPDNEIFDIESIRDQGKEMFFLATKKGLMAHNGRL
jgi:hypothetical protein